MQEIKQHPTSTVSDAGSLTRQLVIGSVQLSGVRQALVTVFRLHIPRVRRNVELWQAVDMLAGL